MATDIWWNGSVNTDLATDANWTGGVRPTSASDTMGFNTVPSKDYTLTLTNDLAFAGTWKFANGAQRHTFDLGGHTLTFLTAYADPNSQNVTNVIKNGTIAFTNATGVIQESRFWHPNSGYRMFIEKGGRYIAHLKFTDTGTKHLTIEDGGYLKGSIMSYGTDCRVFIRDEGTLWDAANGTLTVGGTGLRSHAYVTDGAVVTNLTALYLASDPGFTGAGNAYLCVSNATLVMRTKPDDGGIGKNAARFLIGDRSNNKSTHCNRMDVIAGAKVTAGGTGTNCAVGNGHSHSNLLYVAGEGSVFSNAFAYNADQLLISGQSGNYNQIHVTSNAFLYSQSVSAGGQAKNFGDNCVTSMCNRITVDGGAKLKCTQLYVAARHDDDAAKAKYLTSLICSNTVEVLEGGTVQAGQTVCGTLKPSFGNSIVVRGKNATLSCSSFILGRSGSSCNSLEVTDGGRLKMTGDLNIGCFNAASSNNWARIEGSAFTNDSKTISVGSGSFPNNRLWFGSGSAVSYGTCKLGGLNSELIVSNATLRLGTLSVTANGAQSPKFSFYGPTAKILTTGNGTYNFTNNTVFAFHVPEGGYLSAPFESNQSTIYLRDDVDFEMDLSAVRTAGVKTTLFHYSGGNATAGSRINVSQTVLDRLQTAACQQVPGSKVTLSADAKKIELRVPRAGLMLLFR